MKSNKNNKLRNSRHSPRSYNFLLKICFSRAVAPRKISRITQFHNSLAFRGSSLLETLIYAAILGLVAVLTTGSILAMMKSYSSIKLSRDMNLSASVAMNRISNEIRLSNNLDDAGSLYATSSGKLKLNTVDDSGLPITLEFFLADSSVYLKEGSGSAEALTSSSTEATALVFNKIFAASTSVAVKIKLTTKIKNGTMEKTENFYDTAILRGSY